MSAFTRADCELLRDSFADWHLSAFTRADEEKARALFQRSLAILREIGDIWQAVYVIRSMGLFAFGRGQTFEAKRHYEEAL